MALFSHRLTELEKKVDAGFAGVNATIISTSVSYVRADLYDAQREADRSDVEAGRKLAMWALGIVVSTALGAIVLGIVSASGIG